MPKRDQGWPAYKATRFGYLYDIEAVTDKDGNQWQAHISVPIGDDYGEWDNLHVKLERNGQTNLYLCFDDRGDKLDHLDWGVNTLNSSWRRWRELFKEADRDSVYEIVDKFIEDVRENRDK